MDFFIYAIIIKKPKGTENTPPPYRMEKKMERKLLGFNENIKDQNNILKEIIMENAVLSTIIKKAPKLELKHYYIGGGCIAQTVWNYQNGLDLLYGISDVDLVYYDPSDLSYDAEDCVVKAGGVLFREAPLPLDIKNQARTHLWYEKSFGYPLNPYPCVEAAINSWPTTATSVGVRLIGQELVVYAPYGLNDLFGQIIRANKTQITETTYRDKADKWLKKWNTLTVIPW